MSASAQVVILLQSLSDPGTGAVSHAGGRSGWKPKRVSNTSLASCSNCLPPSSVLIATSSHSWSFAFWCGSTGGLPAPVLLRRCRRVVIHTRARQSAALPTAVSLLARRSLRRENMASAKPSSTTPRRASANSLRKSVPLSRAICWRSSGS